MAYSAFESKRENGALPFLSDEQFGFLLKNEAEFWARVTSSKPEGMVQKGHDVVRVRANLPTVGNIFDDFRGGSEYGLFVSTHTPKQCGNKQLTLANIGTVDQSDVNYIGTDIISSYFTVPFFNEHKDMIISIFTAKWNYERSASLEGLKKALEIVEALELHQLNL